MARGWATRSDREVLAQASRDAAAFEELYRRHEAIVAAFLARRTRDAELAADLTMETFAAALLSAGRFRGDGSVAGFLLGIARNQMLHALRRGRADVSARRRLGAGAVSLTDASLERVEALVDAAALSPQLTAALDALSDHEREAVRAYVLDERPYAELAAGLGIPEATVRKRVSRGLARMRSALEADR